MTQPAASSTYVPDAVPVGPFETDPLDLMSYVCMRPDGSWRGGDEIRAYSEAWMVGALTVAGVRLGHHDKAVIGLLAEDGWPTVQVIAGWISRAWGTQERCVPSNARHISTVVERVEPRTT